MDNDNREKIVEKPTTHKKTTQIYLLIVVGVLCVVMIFDIVRKSAKEKEDEVTERQKTEQRAERSHGGETLTNDQERFERQIAEETRRIKMEKNDPPKETTDEVLSRMELRKKELQQAGQRDPYLAGRYGANLEKSFEEQWREQERKRALTSRQASFGLQDATGPNVGQQGLRQGLNNSLQAFQNPRKNIVNKQEIIDQEIDELTRLQEEMIGGNGSAGQQAAHGFFSSEKENHQERVVGKPESEDRVQPGQLLLPTATVIRAVLDQDLMSDYTGAWRGLVIDDVYDISKRAILIPKGSRVVGRSLAISNINEPVQARMGFTVTWCILPNGNRISFDKDADVLDRSGIGAIKDRVNHHFLAQFMGVAAYALLSSETSRSGTGFSNDETFSGEVGEELRGQFAPLAAKYLSLVPTITIRAGTPMRIFVEDDIYVFPWKSVDSGLLPRS